MKVKPCVLVLISVFSLVGCKRTEKPAGADVQVIDATQFRPAFAGAPPATQTLVNDVMMSIQSSNLKKALGDLETLANQPELSPQQKKAVSDLIPQLRKKLAELAASPTQ